MHVLPARSAQPLSLTLEISSGPTVEEVSNVLLKYSVFRPLPPLYSILPKLVVKYTLEELLTLTISEKLRATVTVSPNPYVPSVTMTLFTTGTLVSTAWILACMLLITQSSSLSPEALPRRTSAEAFAGKTSLPSLARQPVLNF